MIGTTILSGKNNNEPVYRITETTLTDATDYIAVPMGFSPNPVSVVPAAASAAAVYHTTKVSDTPSGIADGDWTEVSTPTNVSVTHQVTWVKIVATGTVVVRGFLR